MTVVFAISIFIVGALVGAIAFKLFATSAIENKQLSEQVSKSEAELAQYKSNVAEHLETSANLLAEMNNTCQAAMKQMEESTTLLKTATPVDITSMPFFSKETQEQLAKTVNLRHQKEENLEATRSEPPLDYSGKASGLFADNSQTVTNT